MSIPNNINTDPLVLSEDSHDAYNGSAQHVNGNTQQVNGNANGQSVTDHAVNAKNSLLNCEVRGRPLASGNLVPLRTCRAAANLQNQSYRTLPAHATHNTL